MMMRRLDIVVLIVADTDYTPLLRKLMSFGVRVMLLSWDFEYTTDEGVRMITKTSHELLSMATYPVAMHDVIGLRIEQNNPLINDLFVPVDPSRQQTERTKSYEVSEVLSLKNGSALSSIPTTTCFPLSGRGRRVQRSLRRRQGGIYRRAKSPEAGRCQERAKTYARGGGEFGVRRAARFVAEI